MCDGGAASCSQNPFGGGGPGDRCGKSLSSLLRVRLELSPRPASNSPARGNNLLKVGQARVKAQEGARVRSGAEPNAHVASKRSYAS